jgi:hypothetical protein
MAMAMAMAMALPMAMAMALAMAMAMKQIMDWRLLMSEYAQMIGASKEVLDWCNTVLKAYEKKNPVNIIEREHVIDYLTSDAAPKRLRKMSYKQAKIAADKWSKAQQKKGADLVDTDEDIELVHDFFDGTKIVKLLTKKSYQREGFFMAHCLGGYDPDNQTIYSYRDKDNKPHATFEVTGDGEHISQIKGKGNGPIHPKYINPILSFLNVIGIEVRPSEMKNLGYYHINPGAKEVLNNFDLSNDKIVTVYGEEYLVG